VSLAILVALTLAGAGEHGNGHVEEQARSLHEAGGQFYDKARYVQAIDAFESAYRLAPRAATAFSLAQSYRVQYFVDGDKRKLERAVEMYRAYLDGDAVGNRRDHATEHLATLVPILERVRAEAPAETPKPAPPPPPQTRLIISSRTPGALVMVDGRTPETAPASFAVTPGKHFVEVSALSHVTKKIETQAVEGSAVAFNVELDPQPGVVEISAPEDARISLDGRPLGAGPVARTSIGSGWHVLSVVENGRTPFVRDLHVAHGEMLKIDAELEVTTRRWIAYGLFAGGAAFALGSGVATGGALGKESDARAIEDNFDARRAISVADANRHATLEGERDDLARVAIVTGSAAIISGTIGLILWLTDSPELSAAAPRAAALPLTSTIPF
jgi:hypothetical protein